MSGLSPTNQVLMRSIRRRGMLAKQPRGAFFNALFAKPSDRSTRSCGGSQTRQQRISHVGHLRFINALGFDMTG
ncbi:MAG: hypothetical protein BWZ07_00223 [Alphaproteobacteria bacterium ADurb.BinA280]|nr:MAG: hypothetical protein BWZ07_00223 [Alphaproteobacteria bacterium ADurb.BinA280]